VGGSDGERSAEAEEEGEMGEKIVSPLAICPLTIPNPLPSIANSSSLGSSSS